MSAAGRGEGARGRTPVLVPLQVLPPAAGGAVGQAGGMAGSVGPGIGAWGFDAPVLLGAVRPEVAWGLGAAVAGGLCGARRGSVGRRPGVVSAGEAIAGASGGRLARVVAAGSAGPGIGAWGFDAPVLLGATPREVAWGLGAAVAGGLCSARRGGVGRRPGVVSAGEAIAGASGGQLARVVAAGSAERRIGAWGFDAPVLLGAAPVEVVWGLGAAVAGGLCGARRGGARRGGARRGGARRGGVGAAAWRGVGGRGRCWCLGRAVGAGGGGGVGGAANWCMGFCYAGVARGAWADWCMGSCQAGGGAGGAAGRARGGDRLLPGREGGGHGSAAHAVRGSGDAAGRAGGGNSSGALPYRRATKAGGRWAW
jgi:hypothetical protein